MIGRLNILSEIVTQLDDLEGVMSDMLAQQQNVEVISCKYQRRPVHA